jgi:hypothetical protein
MRRLDSRAGCGARGRGSQPRTRAASGLRPAGHYEPPARSWLTIRGQVPDESAARRRDKNAAVELAATEAIKIIAEYVETETGKGVDALDRRPQLAAALSAARIAKGSILVSKLDRLSRASHSCPA